ncbi:MAG: transglutaminase-like domain-containing protein, partial [Planctomycetes bacterium]|nr:transglutaminase-like domain-containing protein [Planctomycetota bacterium]
MNRLGPGWLFCPLLVMGIACGNLAGPILAAADLSSLQVGASVPLGTVTATVQRLDTLPFVQSEFTKRFRFDSFDNPKLKELRERYRLDAVVAPGKDEFERQVLLLDWVHHRFQKFGRPSTEARGALEILRAIDEGHAFFCSHYAHVFVSAAASLGWIDRELALRRHQDSPQGGSTEHSPTEIWSNQYRKWVMMDPTAHMCIEKDGLPLNAYEIRQEWFYREGHDLVFVIGKERQKYRKSDLPIFLGRFAGFGDLTVPADELCKYGFIGYIPNTNLMDAGLDYGQMFITKDQLCAGTRWHQRIAPPNPAVDPYFPVNQAAVTLVREEDQLRVALQTLTPNFQAYQARTDG